MKSLLVAIGLFTLSSMAYAADTPTAEPTASERVENARKNIEKKDWNRAITDLNRAVRDEPRNADIHNLLGYSYRKRSPANMAKAFEHYQLALKLDPKHKGAHEYIGEAYLMDKKLPEAEAHLVQLEAICGNKTCEEYADLAKSIADYKAKNK